MDDYFHGTHVAGSIGAVGNNAIGVTGVNWTSSLLACKFLDSTGSGTTAGAITCLDYVAQKKTAGINIVATNNSWGGSDYSQALSDAIAAQLQAGILFVAAAGNNATNNDIYPFYPCSLDHSNIICVASAVDSISLDFSNYGAGTVHLGAPGEGILSTVLNGQYASYDGTSMATAYVTGVVGLLAAQDSTRDSRALKNLVLAGAEPDPRHYFKRHGRAVACDQLDDLYRVGRRGGNTTGELRHDLAGCGRRAPARSDQYQLRSPQRQCRRHGPAGRRDGDAPR